MDELSSLGYLEGMYNLFFAVVWCLLADSTMESTITIFIPKSFQITLLIQYFVRIVVFVVGLPTRFADGHIFMLAIGTGNTIFHSSSLLLW